MRPRKQKEYQVFNGEYFSLDKKSGYWQNTRTRERMHRYVYKYYYGDIPFGFHIHHIDGDKSNNDISNLCLLTPEAHEKLHSEMRTPEQRRKLKNNCDKIRHLTKAWHASNTGREWHKQHYEKMKSLLYTKTEKICLNCGKSFFSISHAKFCCNACKASYRRKNGVDNEIRVCPVCGKEFTVNKYSKTKTCSRKCACALRFNK